MLGREIKFVFTTRTRMRFVFESNLTDWWRFAQVQHTTYTKLT